MTDRLDIGPDWQPTAAINALPDPIRRYIHDLETRCDPAGDIAALSLARDQIAQLSRLVEELQAQGMPREGAS